MLHTIFGNDKLIDFLVGQFSPQYTIFANNRKVGALLNSCRMINEISTKFIVRDIPRETLTAACLYHPAICSVVNRKDGRLKTAVQAEKFKYFTKSVISRNNDLL